VFDELLGVGVIDGRSIKDKVEDKMFIKVMKQRAFPFWEGKQG